MSIGQSHDVHMAGQAEQPLSLACGPQVAGLQSETAQKVLSLPAAPGSLAVNTAASLHGIMVSKLIPCCQSSLSLRSVVNVQSHPSLANTSSQH